MKLSYVIMRIPTPSEYNVFLFSYFCLRGQSHIFWEKSYIRIWRNNNILSKRIPLKYVNPQKLFLNLYLKYSHVVLNRGDTF